MTLLTLDIETCGLQAATDRITCLGVWQQGKTFPYLFTHEDEAELLRRFWAYLELVAQPPRVVTGYNIVQFDLPFIIARSRQHGIEPPVVFDQQLDLMLELFGPRRFRKFSVVAEAFGIKHDNGMTGAAMPEAWLRGDVDLIKDHCQDDLKGEAELYRRLALLGFICPEDPVPARSHSYLPSPPAQGPTGQLQREFGMNNRS